MTLQNLCYDNLKLLLRRTLLKVYTKTQSTKLESVIKKSINIKRKTTCYFS